MFATLCLKYKPVISGLVLVFIIFLGMSKIKAVTPKNMGSNAGVYQRSLWETRCPLCHILGIH